MDDANEKKDLYDSIAKHFSNLFKDSKVGIVITDSNGRFCHVNNAFCRLLKYSEDDLKNLTVKDITHPEDREGLSMFFADGASPQVSPVFHTEKRYLTKEGKSVWARVTATWMFDNNKPVYAAAMIENIGSLRTEQERKRREERQIFELQTAIVAIARNSAVVRGVFSTAIKFIAEKTSQAINVERVGIWLFSPDRKELRCVDLYQHSKKEHSEGMILKAEDYPTYFKALETGRAIDADDALSDPRTEEFAEDYLKPYGIVSMLDAAVRVSGEIVGVVCCEHVGSMVKKWFGAEVHFVAEVADQVAHVILSNERNKAIEELKESEKRFRMMADSAPVMIWVSGEDALCNFFNKQWLDFVGRGLEQELGKGWIQGVHEKDLEMCIEKYLKAFKAREEFEVQYRLKRKDGVFRWVLSKGIPRYTPEGSFQGYIGTCIDITDSKEKQRLEREKVQEKLEQSEEYNRMLFELAPMGLALCTMEGKLVDLNPAYAKIIGRTVDETLGLTYWEITPKKYESQEEKMLENLNTKGVYGPYEKEYIHKDGYLVPVRLSGMILERDGQRYIWSAVQNITEAKKYSEALQDSRLLLQSQKEALEQKNAALREILEQIEIEKKQIKEDVVSNVEALLMPSLRKLRRKGSRLDLKNIKVLENNIKDLTAPFGSKVSDKKWKLTPREIEICNLIKNGLSSKEISKMLNVSFRTVEIHRNNIRKKLEINKKNINLAAYLQSF